MYSTYTHTKELKGMFDNERFIKTLISAITSMEITLHYMFSFGCESKLGIPLLTWLVAPGSQIVTACTPLNTTTERQK